jgi:ATP-dependent Clp protease ATP-binding subunit ClpB
MVRVDMSEFMERHSVARLIGAPPGYVGYEEGGYLTEAIRRKPYSVILFDEVEKAHQDVFNVMLQILDDGRLTDGKGRTVDFKNTVIIMTSNIGSQYIRDLKGDDTEMRRRVTEALQGHFRPEFLNRIDEIIIFNSLGLDEIKKIVDLQMERLKDRLKDRKLDILLTERAKEFIEKKIQNPLARRLLEGGFAEGDTVKIDVDPKTHDLTIE